MANRKSGQQYTVAHNAVGHYAQGETFGASDFTNAYGQSIENPQAEIDRLLALGAIVKGEDLPEDITPGAPLGPVEGAGEAS